MKKLIITLVVIVAILGLLLLTGPFYVLDEGQQALVLRFGEIRKVETSAGLKFKTPFTDNVVTYSKKVQAWDGEPQSILTKEQQYIWVDVTARWRIADPEKFYKGLTSMDRAYRWLSDIIDSAVRTVITGNYLREAVRNTNAIMTDNVAEAFSSSELESTEALRSLTTVQTSYDRIEKGRRALSLDMLSLAREQAPEYGIEIIDVIPRQIRYSNELTESVYQRMIAERSQIAQAFRALGEGKKAEWMGRLENDSRTRLSEAYAEAETIKGKADAEAAGIYAQAYGRDRSFYEFWRAVESYRLTLPSFQKTLSTDMDYFDYLYGPNGR
ncbi:MAG: protease modulator HflC [Spirochaetales bacterium]|nr:protease modulator HflC [Spirochaetales bacterium]MBP7263059.1 protease modulator HflC [Spirochaetia bacterium]